ncbi:n utilization substance protein B homolog [Clostridium sp. CAG:557]|mgnify:FL=1|nr:n utilization substance protein B homolog [Clostridium sp. CAG:557]
MNRRKQRELIFLLLFENIFTGYSLDELKEIKFLTEEFSPEDFNDFIEKYFIEIQEKIPAIDELITKFSLKWGKERLSKVALAILRLAVYEMLYQDEIPTSVAINEAVELSKKYGADKESSFINGMLGGLSRDLEQKNE